MTVGAILRLSADIPSSAPFSEAERKPGWLPLKPMQSGGAYQELMKSFRWKRNKPPSSGISKRTTPAAQ